MDLGLHFPVQGSLYDMAVYAVVSLFWVCPTWMAAKKFKVSRYWTVAAFVSPALLLLLLWHLVMPPAWRPGEDHPMEGLER